MAIRAWLHRCKRIRVFFAKEPFLFEQITVYNMESSVLATPRLIPFGEMEAVWRFT
jgi:hypothetical protein